MPVFEYKCNDCNIEFEALLLNADEQVVCYSCDSNNLEKQFSPFGIKAEGEVASAGSSSSPSGCSHASCGCGVRN